jgi:hypothetical protein
MRIVRRLLLVALAGLAGSALVACGEEKASTKPVATLKGDGFTVAMPGSPKAETITAQTAGGPLPITAYITEGGEEGFSMSVLKIPKGVRGDLDGAVRGAASSVGGTLKDTKKLEFQGFPARDARITGAEDSNGNKGTVFARVILAKGRVFQLQFVTGGADVKSPPKQYTAFVSSLKIG